jgi:hypothetical protein
MGKPSEISSGNAVEAVGSTSQIKELIMANVSRVSWIMLAFDIMITLRVGVGNAKHADYGWCAQRLLYRLIMDIGKI